MKADFFSVLFHSWKSILLVIIVIVIFSVAAIFIIPAYQIKQIGINPSSDLYLEFQTSFNAETFIDSRTLDNYVNRVLQDETLLYQSLKDAAENSFAACDLSAEDYYSSLDFLKLQIKQNRVFFRLVKKRNSYLMILRVNSKFNLDGFGEAYIKNANRMMFELLIPHAEEMVLGFEKSTIIHYPEAVYDNRFARKYNRYLAAFNYMENDIPVLKYIRIPYIREGESLMDILTSDIIRKSLVFSVYTLLLAIFIIYLKAGKELTGC